MADTLVTRVTGQTKADQVPVEVQLVISANSLLHGNPEPAHLSGYGPVPAGQALRILSNLAVNTPAWVRRLFVQPETGQLVSMETSRRLFPEPMRRFLTTRDQLCRTPWCGAPIRHTDHVVPAHQGGATSLNNGQGLCERCNQLKESPGWHSQTTGDDEIVTTAPTGHHYRSRPPPLLEPQPRIQIDSTHPPRAA